MVSFAFEAVGLVIPMEAEMRKPQHYPKIITAALVVVCLLYLSFGSVCYIAFGEGLIALCLLAFSCSSPLPLIFQILNKLLQ